VASGLQEAAANRFDDIIIANRENEAEEAATAKMV